MILPFPVTKPVGGARVMYEYANRLQQKGHQVTIFHSIRRPFKKSRTPLWYKQLVFALRRVARPKWFKLHNDVQSRIVTAINDRQVTNADISISTWWQMTYALSALSSSKGKKFNLVQDYEIWNGYQERVDAGFRLPVNHLAIARYLQKLIFEKNGHIQPELIPNAIDNHRFFIEKDPALRDPYSVIMLYSEEPRKDTATGIKALELVHKQCPQLKVQLFGVYPPPVVLPVFISYIQKPAQLRNLYNSAAIFFSPSLGEGWALPPAEAMACGCAVICTDIGGHQDYAFHEDTALMVQPGNISDMVEKFLLLLADVNLRLRIAGAGNELITTAFSWERSVDKLESCFYEALKK